MYEVYDKVYDMIVIGGGPAGLTAATYARRAGKSVLVLEKSAFGGQITWSPLVENFPAIQSISGTELGDRMLEQAMEHGADVELEEVTSVDERNGLKHVVTDSGMEFDGRALIIAVGAKPRTLGIEREEELVGSGVCYCAVCDGAFYKDRPVAVSGGGSSALQDALMLSEKCSRVYLIHRRAEFRGEKELVERLSRRRNVKFIMEASVTELMGERELESIAVSQRGSRIELEVSGLFVAIGHAPDNSVFARFIDLDRAGYAAADESCVTKTPGVFVAGDCRCKSVRQLTTAVADGSAAALAACAWLDA